MYRILLAALLLAGLACLPPQAMASNPTGTLTDINRMTAVASGTAKDADRVGKSIAVDFWLGSGFTTYVGETITQASNGAFTFQIPAQYRDGTSRSFCAWAINDNGPHTLVGCKAFAQDRAPTGSLDSLTEDSVASGKATDPDRPGQSILVDFWLDSGFTKFLGEAQTVASSGAYTFRVPTQYLDGQPHKVCAWAIDELTLHTQIGCLPLSQLPIGTMGAFDANGVATGTATDPDAKDAEVLVDFYAGRTFANYLGGTTTHGHAFSFQVPAGQPATGEVCAYAINQPSGPNPMIGCATYVKPGLQYYGYFTSSTPFRLGQGDHTSEVTDHANLAWIESNDCWVIARGSEDRRYCDDLTRNAADYYETMPSSGRTVDFYDLIARVRVAKQYGDKAVIHLEQFLVTTSPSTGCFFFRTDADDLIQAVSRQLKRHGLMDSVEVVYLLDEPYLKGVVTEQDAIPTNASRGICSAQGQPIGTASGRTTRVYGALNGVLASIRKNDSQSGEPRFPGKKTAVIFSYAELDWTRVSIKIPADYDWVAYDGYIATGQTSQDYAHYLDLLKQKLNVLPNAASKRIFLVPEAYITGALPESSYPAAQCDAATKASFIPSDDGHRTPECVLLSNFLRAYRTALCDPSIVAIVPFLWQEGLNKTIPLGAPDRYRDLTNYLSVATLVGQGISAAGAGTGPYALPQVSCAAPGTQLAQSQSTALLAPGDSLPVARDAAASTSPRVNASTRKPSWSFFELVYGFANVVGSWLAGFGIRTS